MRSSDKFKILVVEDDDEHREALRTVLERYGYEVTEASNATDAIDLIEKNGDPDLALLDWQLRGPVTGLHVALHLRVKTARFIVSGHPIEVIRGLWEDPLKGVLQFIQKPVRWEGKHGLHEKIEYVRKSLENTPVRPK